MKILIVDDMEENSYLLETLLKGNSHDVVSAVNGKEALEKLREGRFDLIVSDILMPVMDGFQLCRTIRKDEALRHIPFIIYTATYTGPQDEEFALKIGADRFIRKPCDPKEFMEAVGEVMETAKTLRNNGAPAPAQEEESLKLYSARLVRKLEQKMLEAKKEAQVRKEMEDALRISNTRLHLALGSSNIGLWEWNPETNEAWFSPEWKRQLGYEDHEIASRYEEWENRLHPEDRPRTLDELKVYLEGRSPAYNVEFRLRHRDGSYRWIAARGEVIKGPDGTTKSVTGCHVDITRDKEAVQALDAERRKFQVLVDESPLGIALVDKDDHFRYLNPRFIEIFGYDLNDIKTRKDWFEKAYPDLQYRQTMIAMWQKEKETGDPKIFHARPLNIKCKNGKTKQVNIKHSFLSSGDQVVTYEDVSEQIRMEDKLRQAQKMEAIATLAGGIAHDFNNILSAVIGYAELTRNGVPRGSKADEYIAGLLKAGQRAKDLVRHILAFSRQSEHERIPMSPHLVVKEVVSLLRSTLPATIEIRQDVEVAGTVIADPTQIHQVIMNLCTNAYHAMRDKKGILGISVKNVILDLSIKETHPELTAGRYVKLSVSDTGYGMSPEVIARIFDPYYTTKGEREGTGLGLAVVHGIVKSYQGAINVYSEPGKGSVFNVYLPQAEDTTDTDKELHEAEPLPTGNERILFVDDEPVLANLAEDMMKLLRYDVTVCKSAIEALELFMKEPDSFDLVITDMTMPIMTGADLAQELMRIRPDIPVILCTGFSHIMSEEKAKTMGIRESW